jgi:cell division protein FtsB
MKPFRFLDKRILLVAGVIILILLMSDFSNRVSEVRRMDVQKATISIINTQLVATEQDVQAEIIYATSAAAVEKFAREDMKMIKTGDHPIVPMAPAESTPVPTPVISSTEEPVANWEVWYALFFHH